MVLTLLLNPYEFLVGTERLELPYSKVQYSHLLMEVRFTVWCCYVPILVPPLGIEPRTHRLKVCCSNQLSYRGVCVSTRIWTHELSDLQSVPLATLVLQDSTGRGDWTHMQPITLSTVYKTEGICQYIGVLDGIWTHAIRSHNPLLYLTELLTQSFIVHLWTKLTNVRNIFFT